MVTTFQHPKYMLKRQVLALTGKFRLYDEFGEIVLYSQQKMFKLKEDIRVFSDETMVREVLSIHARQMIDFAAAYDVIDSASGQKVGALRRKGFRSMVRDEWEILDVGDQLIGTLREDSQLKALLRRLILGSLLPQNYDLLVNEQKVAEFRQQFKFIGYILDLEFNMDNAHLIDRRLGIAAAILLATIEGKQSG
ncbi:MAG: hypothetical protein IMY76_03890 [Chloroflexi bacterium]|nr:hypothetical protein [Chloroflexota bacterium]